MYFSVLIILLTMIIIISIGMYFMYKNHTYKKSLNRTANNRQNDIIILWDIHGVLFEKSILRWLRLIVTYPHIFTIIKRLDKKTIRILAKYIGKKMGIVTEEITNQELINCAKHNDNQALIDLTTRISCAYKPKFATIALVKKLHELGYVQHIGSNIGQAIFELFAPQYPTIFNYFSYAHIINTQEASTKMKKPNKEFFLSYLAIHKKKPAQIVFVDDRWANIKTARLCGIEAIYFKDTCQLKKEFERLGLLFEKKNKLI